MINSIKKNVLQSHSNLVLFMMDNGKETIGKAMEYRFGQMEPDMKDTGSITKLIQRESSYMLMETFTKVNGKKIKPMVLVFIYILMEPCIKAIGKMIIRMVMVCKHGSIIANTKDCIKMVKKMEKGTTYGLMEAIIKEIG
jgi:hypothetical protein